MKVKVLSLLISTLSVAGTTNAAKTYSEGDSKLDLYGKIDGLRYFSDNKNVDDGQTYMRVGVKGETQIDDQLTGYDQWEYNVQADNTESSSNQAWTRLAFVGLKSGDAGSFDYGHNHGVIYDTMPQTDVLPEFGGDTYGSDNFLQSHASGVVTYRNSDFFDLVGDLNFALQYQGKNDSASGEGATDNGCGAQKQNDDGYGTSAAYDVFDDIGAGFAYSHSKHTNDQNNLALDNGSNAEIYTDGLKHNVSNVYLVTQYTQTYNAIHVGSLGLVSRAQNFEAVAQYRFDFGLRPFMAYPQSEGRNLGGYGDQDLLKCVDVGMTYCSNKGMLTYVGYKTDLLDDSNFTRSASASIDDVAALGLVYQF